MPGTRVTGGTIGRKAAMINTGTVAHFGGLSLESEYPELAPIASVNRTVPRVIIKLLPTWRGKFWVGCSKVRKLSSENTKSNPELMIDLFGRKAKITVQTIGIRVITTANNRVSSSKTLAFFFCTGVLLLMTEPSSSFLQSTKPQQLHLKLRRYKG